jgi:uncharacterized membrane protein YeiH
VNALHVALFLTACGGLLVAMRVRVGQFGLMPFLLVAAGGGGIILCILSDAEPFGSIVAAGANILIWISVAIAMGFIPVSAADD